jgi:uncharacterized protein (TIGR01244 family)
VACAINKSGPVPVDVGGVTNLSRDGNIYISGTATPDGLADLAAMGVLTVLDLRGDDQVPAGDPAMIAGLGMDYVPLPMSSSEMTDAQAEAFLDAMAVNGGDPVLIYCRSANRAGTMYGLYMGMTNPCSVEDAVQLARQAGMTSAGLESDLRRYLEANAMN